MKRVLLLMLVIMMVGLTACGKGGQDSKQTEGETKESQKKTEAVAEKDEPTEEKNDTEEWGVTDVFSTNKDGVLADFYINFPSLTGIPEGTGLIAYQSDATRVVVDAYLAGISPEVNSVSEVFPAYFEQTNKIFRVNLGVQYSDGEFTIESQETETINGYEMCKYVGMHNFKYEGAELSYKYVAYATQTKTNGAYIYWLVQDESADQSLSETIEEYAYKMATTLREE